jgi:protoporphyrinogen oxidase
MTVDAEVCVIGAGPAGLTAAYCLTKETPSVLERIRSMSAASAAP